jgi:hypothetical protein
MDTQSTNQPINRFPYLLFGFVFLIVLALYAVTLAPGVVGGDAGEHQFAVPLLGIPHTTGYPLYVLTGKLWTLLLPIGSPAWRLNLFSAVAGALAAGVTALVVYRLPIGKNRWPGAFVAGLTLAFGLTLWQWSVIAGVRSLNVLFFALLTLQAIVWQQQQQQGQPAAAERTLRWLALTVGLSLAHHRTTLFYLPSLVGWLWWHDRRLITHPKRLLTLTALAVVPLSLYGFIYFRGVNNPPYTHEPIYNLQSFWFLVGSGDSKGLFLSLDPAYLPARLSFIWHDILRQLSWPGVILAGLGGLLLLMRHTRYFLLQGTLVLLLLWFTLDFEVVNLNEAPTWYLMPAYFIFAVWAGAGLNGICKLEITNYKLQFTPRFSIPFKLGPVAVTLLTTLLLAITLARPNWQSMVADSTGPLDEWRQLLRGNQAQRFVESSLPWVAPNAIIWADWEQYTPFKYYRFINNARPDVTVQNPVNEWPQKVAVAHAKGQPVYLARKTADLIGTPYLTMAGPLIQVQAAPQFTAPNDITPVAANFENELELLGYRANITPQSNIFGKQTDDILQITFFWRAPQPPTTDYALSLRLLNQTGQEIYRRDAAHPVLSSYPTTLWTPGEMVADFYELPVPPDSDPVSLHILPYRSEGAGQWHNLTLTGANPPQEGLILKPFQ